jgi:hypothetical protein
LRKGCWKLQFTFASFNLCKERLNNKNQQFCTEFRITYFCKAVPLQTWSGPEGSRKLRFPHFMTTAQDGGKIVSLTLYPLANTPGTHFCWVWGSVVVNALRY